MKRERLLGIAARSIMRNKLRTALTMLGIVIGVAAVIVMVAIGQGARAKIEAQIRTLGTNMIVVTPGSTALGGASQGANTFNRLSIADAEKIRREGTLLTGVSPVIVTRAQVIGGAGNWRTEVDGVSTDYLTIRNWGLQSGDAFGDEDMQAKRKVVLLGNTVANNLFPNGDAVGKHVQLGHAPFTVMGVLAPKGQSSNGTDQDDVVQVPYTTAQDRLSGFSFLGQILASTASEADMAAAENDIRAIMRESHHLGRAHPTTSPCEIRPLSRQRPPAARRS